MFSDFIASYWELSVAGFKIASVKHGFNLAIGEGKESQVFFILGEKSTGLFY
jgi:hypothetical protein